MKVIFVKYVHRSNLEGYGSLIITALFLYYMMDLLYTTNFTGISKCLKCKCY